MSEIYIKYGVHRLLFRDKISLKGDPNFEKLVCLTGYGPMSVSLILKYCKQVSKMQLSMPHFVQVGLLSKLI